MENETRKKRLNAGLGYILPGCMFIGMGVGFLTGNIPVGMFIGMGVGFLIYGVLVLRNLNSK